MVRDWKLPTGHAVQIRSLVAVGRVLTNDPAWHTVARIHEVCPAAGWYSVPTTQDVQTRFAREDGGCNSFSPALQEDHAVQIVSWEPLQDVEANVPPPQVVHVMQRLSFVAALMYVPTGHEVTQSPDVR